MEWSLRQLAIARACRHAADDGTTTTDAADTYLRKWSLEPLDLTETTFAENQLTFYATLNASRCSELDGYPVLVGEPEHQAVGQKIAAALTPRGEAMLF